MPLGTKIEDTGWLNQRDGQLVLRRDDGGTWRLDVAHTARRWVGQRVRVIGTRAEFDLLDVRTIVPL